MNSHQRRKKRRIIKRNRIKNAFIECKKNYGDLKLPEKTYKVIEKLYLIGT